eukprot:12300413-Karenia_brevis.AAC.1
MEKHVEQELERGALENAIKNFRESKGLPYYPLDENGNRSKKQYHGETVEGMMTQEEQELATRKGLEIQGQIARFLKSETRVAWLMESL